MIWHYLAAIVLIKTSLLGLGLISLAIACGALLFMRVTQRRFFAMSSAEPLHHRPLLAHPRLASPETRAAFLLVFKTGAVLHIIPYIVMVIKLMSLEEAKDLVTMGISHLLLHHLFSALIAAVLTILTLRVVLKSNVFPAPASARQALATSASTAAIASADAGRSLSVTPAPSVTLAPNDAARQETNAS